MMASAKAPCSRAMRLGHRLLRRLCSLQICGQQMGDDFGVGLGLEFVAQGDQLVAQLLEILDDAVVHHGDAVGGVGMGVGLVRRGHGSPSGYGRCRSRRRAAALASSASRLAELALGAAAVDMAVHQGGDAGGIIAAIFQPLQPVEQQRRQPVALPRMPMMPHMDRSAPALACSLLAILAAELRLPSRASRPAAPARTASASGATSWVITLPARDDGAARPPSPAPPARCWSR